MLRTNGLNIDSEQKCLQSHLETVHGRRVANGAQQPIPCRQTWDRKCTFAKLCPHPLKYKVTVLARCCSIEAAFW